MKKNSENSKNKIIFAKINQLKVASWEQIDLRVNYIYEKVTTGNSGKVIKIPKQYWQF